MSEETQSENTAVTPVQVTQGTSNRTKYIIIGIVVLVVLGYAAKYAFGMLGMVAINAQLKSHGVEVSGNPASENAVYTFKDGKGNEVKVGTNTKLPDGFPTDVPVYMGNIITSASAQESGGQQYTVTIQSPDAFATIVAYYKSELASKGWKIEQEMNMTDGYTMFVASKESHQLSVLVQQDSKEPSQPTTIMLTTGAKQ